MTIIILMIIGFVLLTLDSYKLKDIKKSTKALHLTGIIIVTFLTGLFFNEFIIRLFTDTKELFNENFVDVGIFNKYIVFIIWLIYIYLNLVIISSNIGISRLLKKSVNIFNSHLLFFVFFSILQTYLHMIDNEKYDLVNEISNVQFIIFLSSVTILESMIVYFLFNNKSVKEIYKEGSLKDEF